MSESTQSLCGTWSVDSHSTPSFRTDPLRRLSTIETRSGEVRASGRGILGLLLAHRRVRQSAARTEKGDTEAVPDFVRHSVLLDSTCTHKNLGGYCNYMFPQAFPAYIYSY